MSTSLKMMKSRTNRLKSLKTVTTAAVGLIIACIAIGPTAHAADPATPDWPCVQRKIDTLTATQMWDGPAITDAMPWRNSNVIRNLVKILMSRRIEIEDAEKAIEKFATTQPADKKDEQLTLLFAGFLDQANARRTKVVKGIEKMNVRQRARSEELERQGVALAEMKKQAADGDKAIKKKIRKAETEYDWDARVFKERQENLPLACEIPILIEQRAFAISRSIRNFMTK